MSRNFELLQRAAEQRARQVLPPDLFAERHAAEPTAGTTDHRLHPQISRLAEQVFFMPGTAAPRVVVFSSVDKPQDENHILAGVGEAIVLRTRMPVCVVDANLCSPSVHVYFGIGNRRGLMDALRGSRPIHECGQQIKKAHLTIVPTGMPEANWPQLITSDTMAARMAELRSAFAYVLVQSAPLGLFTHGLFLAQFSDGLVLTLEANATRREQAGKIKQDLARAQVRLLGAVLNNRTYPIPQAIYSKLW